jgi:AcrR family transcriptional regulator
MTTQATLRAPRQDNRRQQLLDAAARLFAHQGYRAATIREIAGQVGMLPGSVYYHFPSKTELLLAVYGEGVRRIAAKVDQAVAGEMRPWLRLEAACAAHLETILDHSDYAQVIIRVLPRDAEALEGELTGLRNEYEGRFARLVAELPLPPETERRIFRLMLLGAINWTQAWYHPGDRSPGEIAREFVGYLRYALDKEDTAP